MPDTSPAGDPPTVVWEDPPPPISGTRMQRPDWADTLMSKPGQWARVQEFETGSKAANAAASIAWGRNWAKPKGAWEAVSRKIDGRYWLYARYVGASTNETTAAPGATEG